MKLNKHENEYKEILSLIREQNKLWKEKWAVKPVKLDKPISHGFVRTLSIRPENYLRGDYSILKEAFEFIGFREVFSMREDFIVIHKNNHKEEKHARLRWYTDPRYTPYVSDAKRIQAFEKIEKLKSHLKHVSNYYECSCGACNCKVKDFRPHYEFKKPWLLEEKTQINWLTHYTPIIPEIESRLSEIFKRLESLHGWEKIYGNRRKYDDYYSQIKIVKENVHAYLHGYPIPRIEDLYE